MERHASTDKEDGLMWRMNDEMPPPQMNCNVVSFRSPVVFFLFFF